MNVEIKEKNKIRLAIVEHRGDPATIVESVEKLIAWAKVQTIDLKPNSGDAFAIAYDDLSTTAPEKFRMDLGIRIPENFNLTGEVNEKFLPEGRYAIVLHKGSRDNIADAVYGFYREWLPNSGEELGDFPCVFCYLNFERDVAETDLLTECLFLLK